MKMVALAPEYSLMDVFAYFSASAAVMERVYDPLMAIDLPSRGLDFQIPVFFFLGRHDYNTPSPLAEWYLRQIKAPYKLLVWFERSAHAAMLAQPDDFARALIELVRPLAE